MCLMFVVAQLVMQGSKILTVLNPKDSIRINGCLLIYDALRDLLSFAKFKNVKNSHGEVSRFHVF